MTSFAALGKKIPCSERTGIDWCLPDAQRRVFRGAGKNIHGKLKINLPLKSNRIEIIKGTHTIYVCLTILNNCVEFNYV